MFREGFRGNAETASGQAIHGNMLLFEFLELYVNYYIKLSTKMVGNQPETAPARRSGGECGEGIRWEITRQAGCKRETPPASRGR